MVLKKIGLTDHDGNPELPKVGGGTVQKCSTNNLERNFKLVPFSHEFYSS